MTVSSPTEVIEQALATLNEFRSRVAKMNPNAIDMLAVENEVRQLVNRIGLGVVGEAFARADSAQPEVTLNGQLWGNWRRTRGTYFTMFGELTCERSTYQRSGRGRVLVPLEARLGLIEGRYTPGIAHAVAHGVAVTTATEAEGLFQRLGVTVSVSTIQRLSNAMAAREQRERAVIEPAVRGEDPIPDAAAVMQVGLDGVMVAQDGELAKPRGRATDVPSPARHEIAYGPTPAAPADDDGKKGAAWHEASVGTIAFFDAAGEHLKTIYLGEMPEVRKETLAARLEAEASAILAERPELKVAFASDGAPVHWEHLETMAEHFAEQVPGFACRMLMDAAHVSKYLHDAAKVIDGAQGEHTAKSRARAARWKTLIQEADDGPDRVLGSLRYFRDTAQSETKREALDAIIGFIAGQHEHGRLAYAAASNENFPIGTGVTEAAAKTLVNVRMKRAGARYSQHGGQTILLFRAALLSERLDLLCAALGRTYRANVDERIAA